ncbi:hypothetical protein K1X76_08935 [bacterium]|nr:hypothetical protein [bacterium]
MKFNNLSREAVSELLMFLAENESFDSIKKQKGVTRQDVVEIFKEISKQLMEEELKEGVEQRVQFNDSEFSPKVQALISSLSPREEMLLFKSFKIL